MRKQRSDEMLINIMESSALRSEQNDILLDKDGMSCLHLAAKVGDNHIEK